MSKKEFSNETCSRINDLYASIDDVQQKNAALNVYDQKITFANIQEAIKQRLPFIATANKNCLLDIDNCPEQRVLNNVVPKSSETAIMEIIKVQDFPQVSYYPAEVKLINGKIRYLAPRFTIDLSQADIKPHQGVCVNTGYSIHIPAVTMGRSVEGANIVNTKFGRQLDYVIVPQLFSKNQGIIQAIYGRDPEDSGLVTFNFTTKSTVNLKEKLQVILWAYSTTRPITEVTVVDADKNAPDLFKSKDSRTGRFVKNPKIKIHANSFDVKSVPGSLLLKTFDNKSTPIITHPTQKVKIDGVITMFTSRKREWFNPNLVTSAGIFNPVRPNDTCEAVVIKGSEFSNNTHCLMFVKNKITLLDVVGKLNSDVRLLNGSFSNYPNYTNIIQKLRHVIASLYGLSVGAVTCRGIAKTKPECNVDALMRLYDYHRNIDGDDPNLAERCTYTDAQMFNERPSNAYSVNLYNAFKSLVKEFCADKFTVEQIKEMGKNSTDTIDNSIADDYIENMTEVAAIPSNGDLCSKKDSNSADAVVAVKRKATEASSADCSTSTNNNGTTCDAVAADNENGSNIKKIKL